MTVHDRSGLYVGGRWVTSADGTVVDVVSPHTEQVIARASQAGERDVDRAVRAARLAFDEGEWSGTAPEERIEAVRRLGRLYGERRDEFAMTISAEMGAPISFSRRAQVALPLAMIDALCDVAEKLVWFERRAGLAGQDILVSKDPLGVVAAIVPWNMPQFLIVSKVVPALLAGCSVVLKPAPETPLDALLFADVVHHAGIPDGVVNVVPGASETGAALVAHPGVDKVSFTGSTEAGRKVAASCGLGLKRSTLELGGKSAAIILDDADPEAVAVGVRYASLGNSGQICNALTRVLVPAAREGEFADALASVVSGLKVGDPSDPTTDLGPLVSQRQQHRVMGYIEEGVREGARVAVGGPKPPTGLDRGWYVQPTVFTGVDNHMRIAREEIFGPVLTVIPYGSLDEAIEIANDSDYGLAGAVWTEDVDRGLDIASRVRTGTFGVNQAYVPDPLAPFGGVKASGYGRELGTEGIESYLDIKSISVAPVAST